MSHFVYILLCADGSYYIGQTTDLEARVSQHNAGQGAAWTAARRPVRLVFHEFAADAIQAAQRERQIKGWSHAKKRALIEGDALALKALAKRRT
jgi:putative endonuclease